MRGLILIEAHGHLAVLLHLRLFLHLRHVLFVRHPCRHGLMLLGGDDGHECQTGEREDREKSNQLSHYSSIYLNTRPCLPGHVRRH
jgi:hypothetical protein